LVLSIWGQLAKPDKPSHYFNFSLLEDEKRRVEMLQAWEGKLPKPSSDLEWALWLEATTRRVLACIVRLTKESVAWEERRLKRIQRRSNWLRSSSNKTQLMNKCGTSCPNRKESYKRSSKP
jgi:hypothetical protein